MGRPLSNDERDNANILSLKPDAVIISHPHQDHYGLLDILDKAVPVYIGALAKQLIDVTRIFLGMGPLGNPFRFFEKWTPIRIGDFSITPYLMDHSAVDAYAFLVEAENKRIFYSGDFRSHGRKSILFDKLTEKPPKDIDVLLMEGTMIRRDNTEYSTERAVEDMIYMTIRSQENISFLISSSQNIDRIVSAYNACKRAGKTLVLDLYTTWVLECVQSVSCHTPSIGWDNLRVYADHAHDKVMREHPSVFAGFRRKVYQYRVRREELKEYPSNYLYLIKASRANLIERFKGKKPVNVIYSQWLGYVDSAGSGLAGADKLSAYRQDKDVNFIYAHTSGHATTEDLQVFEAALKPKQLIPIHTEFGHEYSDLFHNVRVVPDGQILEI